MNTVCATAAALLAVVGLNVSRAQTAGDYNRAGLTHYREHHLQEAINSFDQALKLDAGNPLIRSNLAAACHNYAIQQAENGALEQALNSERRAFVLDGNNPVVRAQLALCCNNCGLRVAHTGDIAVARALLSEAMQLEPGNGVFVTNVCALILQEARGSQAKGEDDRAAALFDEAARLDPRNSSVQAALGEFYYGKNDYAASIRSLERALSLNPAATNLAARLEQIRKEASVEKGFGKNDRSHFVIRYEAGVNEDLSWNISGILDDAYREIGQKLQCWPTAQITVIVYSKEQFKAVTSARDWMTGRFDGKLRICASDLTLEKEVLRRVVRHEYTHALVHNLYGAKLPLWINEGIARHAESGSGPTEREMVLLRSIGENSLVPPWDLNHDFNSDKKEAVALAYLESQLFVKYLFERYGNHVARQFIRENAKGGALDEIMRSMFNMTPEQMNAEWLADLKKQMSPQ